VQQGLTIGEFAQLTHLSVRTLRRYHESGLLEPATVDSSSGYRYYSSAQIPSAQVIHRLRELDVPLAEVGEILATEDPRTRAELIAGHLQRLEARLDRTRAAVTSLRQARLRDLPRRSPGRPGSGRLAHRDRLADLPPRAALTGPPAVTTRPGRTVPPPGRPGRTGRSRAGWPG
jgi:DNA-binding transcriptional MerR regulator